MLYILDNNGHETPIENIYKWAEWYNENKDRLVIGCKEIKDKRGKVVATVQAIFTGKSDNAARPLPWVVRVVGTCDIYHVATRKEAEAFFGRLVRMLERMYR